MSGRPVAIFVAVSRNGVIGRGGDMPWRLSTDLKRFKAMTMGKPLVLGRKTLDSFGGRPLPGRPHVVVTRNEDYAVSGIERAGSLAAALARAQGLADDIGADEVAVIGGGEIYAQAMDLADILYVTHVEADIDDGDTVFPAIDPQQFELTDEVFVPAGEKDSFATRFATYRRRMFAV